MQRDRPVVRGKFVWQGERKLYVRGVTYGTFRPGEDGVDYPARDQVEADFAAMAAAGFNTVRTYTVPPRWLLDIAGRHDLLVFVGVPWEQHITFLDDPKRARSIEERVREGVRSCARHPAVLAYSIGNEIPASIVRWHGRERVKAFLERLYHAAKDEDPDGLVTYVNFPTTEYLELPFLDICAFNVYLESEERLEAYLARLQVVADERPLLMAEIGLDSRSNGEQAQADSLRWQLRTAFRSGCAGAMVFAWTDEWHRGGFDIEDWDFGLVRRDRTPKPALAAVRETLGDLPLPPPGRWPRMSVVVCSYNGARTLRECLAAATAIDYPDYEVIVVDDGSTDATSEIARSFGVRLVRTPNRGLSSARNTGAQAATGEIVAYCDDDAAPDPHWLTYLATTYMTTDHVGVGGPNLAPPDDGAVADCVANAPGNAIHVLLSDTVAEHIPGCNSSFRRDALLEVGGFDPQFRVAGDDVDLCWRLQERGWTIGFNVAAMVWHHRRGTVRTFWRQQRGYGRAEAMLERKWPDKYNGAGHVAWAGRVYTTGRRTFLERWRVYYGTWGTGFFQRLYPSEQSALLHVPLMPEWFLVIALLTLLTAMAAVWPPMVAAAPLLAAAIGAVAADVWRGAQRARFTTPAAATRWGRLRLRALTAFLFVLQSYARLHGRLSEGLHPWSRRARPMLRAPRRLVRTVWSEEWQAVEDRLRGVESRLRSARLRVCRGGDFDAWDLEVRGGVLAGARLRMAVEEHGAGRQLVRFALAPRLSAAGIAAIAVTVALGLAALADGAALAFVWFAAVATLALGAAALEAGSALAGAEVAVDPPAEHEPVAALDGAEVLLQRVRSSVQLGEVVAVVDPEGGDPLDELLLALGDREDGGALAPVAAVDGTKVAVLRSEPVLLPMSVAENISLGRPDATLDDVRAAAFQAGADAFIQRLPRGYKTLVGGPGDGLSEEERHRLALARAFLQDAPVLVVTEPLDRFGNGSGRSLHDVIGRLTEGRRTLVVAEPGDVEDVRRVFTVEGDRLVEVA